MPRLTHTYTTTCQTHCSSVQHYISNFSQQFTSFVSQFNAIFIVIFNVRQAQKSQIHFNCALKKIKRDTSSKSWGRGRGKWIGGGGERKRVEGKGGKGLELGPANENE